MPTTTKANADQILAAIKRAVTAVEAAQRAAYEDTRTSGTVCTDHLDAALKLVQGASQWYTELRREEKADERTPSQEIKQVRIVAEFCHICDTQIPFDDVAKCGGCDKPTCPDCMGDDGICKTCEADPD